MLHTVLQASPAAAAQTTIDAVGGAAGRAPVPTTAAGSAAGSAARLAAETVTPRPGHGQATAPPAPAAPPSPSATPGGSPLLVFARLASAVSDPSDLSEITVPDGVGPGDTIDVEFLHGGRSLLVLPAGSHAGTVLTLSTTTLTATGTVVEPRPTPLPAIAPQPPAPPLLFSRDTTADLARHIEATTGTGGGGAAAARTGARGGLGGGAAAAAAAAAGAAGAAAAAALKSWTQSEKASDGSLWFPEQQELAMIDINVKRFLASPDAYEWHTRNINPRRTEQWRMSGAELIGRIVTYRYDREIMTRDDGVADQYRTKGKKDDTPRKIVQLCKKQGLELDLDRLLKINNERDDPAKPGSLLFHPPLTPGSRLMKRTFLLQPRPVMVARGKIVGVKGRGRERTFLVVEHCPQQGDGYTYVLPEAMVAKAVGGGVVSCNNVSSSAFRLCDENHGTSFLCRSFDGGPVVFAG